MGVFLCVAAQVAWLSVKKAAKAGENSPSIRLGVVTWLKDATVKGEKPTFTYALEAAKAYFSEVNANGGIHGRKIELVVRDSPYRMEETIQATTQLLEDEPDLVALMWPFCDVQTAAVLEASRKTEIPVLFPISNNKLRNRRLFQLRPSSLDENDVLVRIKLPLPQNVPVAMVSERDDTCMAGRESFLRFSERKISADYFIGPVDPEGNWKQEMNEHLNSLIKKESPIVFLNALTSAIPFLEEAHRKGFHPLYIAGSTINLSMVTDEKRLLFDNIYATEYLPLVSVSGNLPIVQELVRLMTKAGFTTLNQQTLQGLLGAKLVEKALLAAGPNPTRSGLAAALMRMNDLDIGGIKLSFSETKHRGTNKTYLYKYEKGIPREIPMPQIK